MVKCWHVYKQRYRAVEIHPRYKLGLLISKDESHCYNFQKICFALHNSLRPVQLQTMLQMCYNLRQMQMGAQQMNEKNPAFHNTLRHCIFAADGD